MNPRDIHEQDFQTIREVESIVDAFSRAVFVHVMSDPQLKKAFKSSSTKSDRLITETIQNWRHSLPNPYDAETNLERHQLYALHSILSAQREDRVIAVARRLIPSDKLSGMLPETTPKNPVEHIRVMEKYGIRHSAYVLAHKLEQ